MRRHQHTVGLLAALAGAAVASVAHPAPRLQNPEPRSLGIRYVRPADAIPGGRVSENQSRGVRGSFPLVEALVPAEHVPLTTKPQPVLFWYLSRDTSSRLEFTLYEQGSARPLVHAHLKTPYPHGLHRIELSGFGLVLRKGPIYKWLDTLVNDATDRTKDALCGGQIKLGDVSPDLERSLLREVGLRRANAYAGNGVWYEALETAFDQLQANPGSSDLRESLAMMLESEGLAEVAEFARVQ